jgi:hypothetical protein
VVGLLKEVQEGIHHAVGQPELEAALLLELGPHLGT